MNIPINIQIPIHAPRQPRLIGGQMIWYRPWTAVQFYGKMPFLGRGISKGINWKREGNQTVALSAPGHKT